MYFRSWHGSVQALDLLRATCLAQGMPASKSAAAAVCAQVVREVAALLGNTAAVCRKAYIHPAVLALAHPAEAEGACAFDWSRLDAGPAPSRGLQAGERRLLRLLALVRREALAAERAAARAPRGRRGRLGQADRAAGEPRSAPSRRPARPAPPPARAAASAA
jgi:DNA topoisomerase-1